MRPYAAESKAMTRQAKARILLVDDDPIILDNLSELLESEGYHISTASDVASAIGVLEGSQCNLVITDVSMPTCEGF